ncbi:MAG: helix-turn-helix domain-containing protein [Streptosporangiales bacterium]|nr:helix-turn-helix domain-containing protein [Streptosporangiales bacterium]
MAMTLTGSALQRHARLGKSMRQLRGRAGLGSVEAARRAGVSQATISRLENGRHAPKIDTVRTLCMVYGATPEERDELLRLAELVRQDSLRSRVVLPRGAARLQARFTALDKKTSLRRAYSPTMVPGLLQTASYVRTLFTGRVPDEDVEEVVQERLKRRGTLGKDARQQHVVIITEGSLRWQLGSPALMLEQIEVIAEISRLPNVRLGIIPWTRSVAFACTVAFDLYDDATAMVGIELSSEVFTDPGDVQVYLDLFGQAEAAAVFGDDARRELARVAADYRMLA